MDGRPDDALPGPSGDGDDDPAIERAAGEVLDVADERVLAALARAAIARDPMPPGLVDRARFAVALEELDVEVAAIQQQATDDARGLAGVRGGEDQALTMTFTASSLSLTVAVAPAGRGRHRLDGWVTSDDPVVVTLRLGDEERRRAEVADGRFVFDEVPDGMVQVVVQPEGEDVPAVVTPVFEL